MMDGLTSRFSSDDFCRDVQLNEREAAVALREQRVGHMDSELLATFGALPNGNSSSSKEARILSTLLGNDSHASLCQHTSTSS